jgi:putative glutathione S-transferase
MLVNGEWVGQWQPLQGVDEQGGFVRKPSVFRNWISSEPEAPFSAEPDRYHLYVSMTCPWACRTLMVLKLKGLDRLISVSLVAPELGDQGWYFAQSGKFRDPQEGALHLHELYSLADSCCNGRATVPVLWDKKGKKIVNNESADIIRILNSAFDELTGNPLDLYPEPYRKTIDRLNDLYYENFNNGVYRAGFATTQSAYESAVRQVFDSMTALEERLQNRSYLCGEQLTEVDVRIFVTLIRFDIAYHGLFKCNLRRVSDYPALSAFMERVYQLPGISETVDVDLIKRGYYSILSLNPGGVVPLGPELPAYMT